MSPAVSLAAAVDTAERSKVTPAQERDRELVRRLSRAHVLARGAMLDGDGLQALCKGAVDRVVKRESTAGRPAVSDDERGALAQRLALDVLARFGRRGDDGRTLVPLASVGREWATMRATSLLRKSREWRDTADGWRASENGATVAAVSPLASDDADDGDAAPLDLLTVAVQRDTDDVPVPAHEWTLARVAAAALRSELAGRESMPTDAHGRHLDGALDVPAQLTDTDERRIAVAILTATSDDAAAAVAELAAATGRTFRAIADGDGDRGRKLLRTHWRAATVADVVRDAAHAAAVDTGAVVDPFGAAVGWASEYGRLAAMNGRGKLLPSVDALPDPTGPGRRVRDGRANAPAVGGAAAVARHAPRMADDAARRAAREERGAAAVAEWLDAIPTGEGAAVRAARRTQDDAAMLAAAVARNGALMDRNAALLARGLTPCPTVTRRHGPATAPTAADLERAEWASHAAPPCGVCGRDHWPIAPGAVARVRSDTAGALPTLPTLCPSR